ncbi:MULTISPECIES: GNAT family N-acetyltransferase [Ruegeria]|uniref:GNAT family N-acetyltransferase n=1 Tax=Ruegeria atlantica TaxID=81569 RepID=A0ABX1W6N3_9RHOB|nr:MULTISPECIES: GNAT family N-acetyltransferase [Ruegeria]NOC91372.1 GNAT family N-acetyltransferase [Ruegeria sp. HKCCD6604]NOD28777.1 GNAT family N-acetyltransferase [Ruegeria atlantica]NOD98370.1 GNAT family N-acetyltransferase [Ruegeria sp. HKCCD6228]QFT73659.1 Acetyltransferase (GNAT) family protein [Ruegeria sp. THAF33]
MSDYVIRPLTVDEVQKAVDWAGREGWNPGHHDARCFHGTDTRGFLGGFLDGEMIASISVVQYDDAFAFLGFYIVLPEFRGSGHGLKIWRHALENCNAGNIGLDGVVDQQHNYRSSGFSFAYNNYRFTATVEKLQQALTPSTGVEPLTAASEALFAYDRHLFPARRDAFLQGWISAPGHMSRVYSEDGQIKGYATLRPCRTGYKIGPLFADRESIAEALLASLLETVPAHHSQDAVFIDMPLPNTAAFALAAKLGLEKVFETARMYSGRAPDIDLSRVFGVTSFELG